MLNKLNKFISDKEYRFFALNQIGLYHILTDKRYLKKMYTVVMGKKLNLDDPQTFNEKLQWLKIHDRKEIYTTMVDKYEAKKYVAGQIGEDYIIPTLGVWERFDDIDFSELPRQFVLKCTHDSGGLVICRDKDTLDVNKARCKIERSMKNNYYWLGREWPYKNVKPRIIAEKYMEDNNNDELTDYKMMCFNGKVKCTFTVSNRSKGESMNVTFYDTNWDKMPFERHYPAAESTIPKPISYEEMVKIAEQLSSDIPFARVDFYEIKDKPYFGEITFYPGCGMEEFTPEEWDLTLGTWISLPNLGGGILCSDNYVIWIHPEDSLPNGLVDYKFYCFDGTPQLLYVSKGLEDHETARISFLTTDWSFAPYERKDYRPFVVLPPKPKCFEQMMEISKKLSKGFSFLRVDLYEINNKVYFSELTFSPCSGMMPFSNEEQDYELGKMLDIKTI